MQVPVLVPLQVPVLVPVLVPVQVPEATRTSNKLHVRITTYLFLSGLPLLGSLLFFFYSLSLLGTGSLQPSALQAPTSLV